MIIKAEQLNKLESLASPYLKKGHAVLKPVWITFFTNKYAVKLSNKPDKETIEFNKLFALGEQYE